MVLGYWGVQRDQPFLAALLDIVPELGAPASRIIRLEGLGMVVQYGLGDWSAIQDYLNQRIPLIVAIQAGELAHWQGHYFQHAVVIVGYDDETILLLDPAAEIHPLTVGYWDSLALGQNDYFYGALFRASVRASW
jgi:hypothetical protein